MILSRIILGAILILVLGLTYLGLKRLFALFAKGDCGCHSSKGLVLKHDCECKESRH
ncbi:MAG: hypothetical protein K6F05_06040 [Succinivibrio sp.]|nr:hypothetical protein [Succinivibrio sp.]